MDHKDIKVLRYGLKERWSGKQEKMISMPKIMMANTTLDYQYSRIKTD